MEVPDNGVLPRQGKVCRLGIDTSGFTDFGSSAFRNLGEIFFSLMFQSFQPSDLLTWLPPDVAIEEKPRGLNISVPVTQWHHRSIASFWTSPDLKVVEYARAAVAKSHFLSVFKAMRKRSKYQYLKRAPDPSRGEPVTFEVSCVKCGWIKVDHAPQFFRRTSQYEAREWGCMNPDACVKELAGKSDERCGFKSPRRIFIPLPELIMEYLGYSSFNKRMNAAQKDEWVAF